MTNGTNKKIEWVTKEPVKYQNWMGPNPDYDGTNSGVRIASDYYVQGDGWIMERGTWDDMRAILIANSSVLNSAAAESDQVNEFAESIKYSTIILTTVPVLCIYPFLQ